MPAEILDHVRDALPDTTHRVARHTSSRVNSRLRDETEASVRRHARVSSRIDRRLAELDREWDIERTLETNAALISLAGIGLAAFVDRRFLLLPAAVSAFLLQHAIQGWCPPVPVFRRRGVRTAAEIGAERTALKALRGDFDGVRSRGAEDADRAARDALRAALR
ncbi:MAG TPA: hypothetical protein VK943_04965 [Arenibaculum sp.]|nr:hypothetical protein [Arenibaculum sp.]